MIYAEVQRSDRLRVLAIGLESQNKGLDCSDALLDSGGGGEFPPKNVAIFAFRVAHDDALYLGQDGDKALDGSLVHNLFGIRTRDQYV